MGDTAWSLIAELKRKEVNRYLADRKRRGFNTLLVNLLEHRFASKAPSNAYGDPPFTSPGDYATPNKAYFGYADWVLNRAAKEGFLVLLAPSYVGARDTDDGWWQEMASNSTTKMRAFGRYLGRCYAHLDNIVWVNGGDDNPPKPGLVDALAAGISETDPGALQTAHTARVVPSRRLVWTIMAGHQQRVHVRGRVHPINRGVSPVCAAILSN